MLTFREGKEMDSEGKPTGVTESTIILQGQDVTSATVQPQPNQTTGKYEDVVVLKLSDEGKQKFAEATARLATENGVKPLFQAETEGLRTVKPRNSQTRLIRVHCLLSWLLQASRPFPRHSEQVHWMQWFSVV